MKILIDGYNLIFQCGLQGRTAGSLTLEKARNRLLSALGSRLDEATRSTTTIVFDAKNRPVKEVSNDQRVDGIHVVYAVGHEEADSLIEEMIRKHSTPKKLLVVSSDHRIQEAARRRKATAIDSDVWFDKLEQNLGDKNAKNASPTGGKPSLGDYNPFPPGYGDDF